MSDYTQDQVVDACLTMLRANDYAPVVNSERTGGVQEYRHYQIWPLMMTAFATELLHYIENGAIDTYPELRIVAEQMRELFDTAHLTFKEKQDD